MSTTKLTDLAGKITSVAATVPYSPATYGDNPTVLVRRSNIGVENLISCGVGYALPLPTAPVASPKIYFGQTYGECLSALVSMVCEHRILNPEILLMNISNVWMNRYAQTFDVTMLSRIGGLEGCKVSGLDCISDYNAENNPQNISLLMDAITQIGKLTMEYHTTLTVKEPDHAA